MADLGGYDMRRQPTAAEVVGRLKDDGDFDALRRAIIRKVKDNVSTCPLPQSLQSRFGCCYTFEMDPRCGEMEFPVELYSLIHCLLCLQ
jgi:hypothetical protein